MLLIESQSHRQPSLRRELKQTQPTRCYVPNRKAFAGNVFGIQLPAYSCIAWR